MPKSAADTPSGRKARGGRNDTAATSAIATGEQSKKKPTATTNITSSSTSTSNSAAASISNGSSDPMDIALDTLQDQLQRVDELCVPSETKSKVGYLFNYTYKYIYVYIYAWVLLDSWYMYDLWMNTYLLLNYRTLLGYWKASSTYRLTHLRSSSEHSRSCM